MKPSGPNDTKQGAAAPRPTPSSMVGAKPQVPPVLQKAQALLKAGKTAEAIQILYDLLVASARRRNFQAAEALYQKIYQIDAMDLTTLIRAREIIDEEKEKAVDPGHRKVFETLYAALDQEEVNTLFYAIERVSFAPDEAIFKQGAQSRHLCFIDSGTVKLVHDDGTRQMLIQTLEPGQLVGSEIFRGVSVCTVSAVTIGSVKAGLLAWETIAEWRGQHPALVQKLAAFCEGFKPVSQQIRERGLNRRRHPRRRTDVAAEMGFLDKAGGFIGQRFRVKLVDLSQRGGQVLLRIASEASARTLVGRRLHLAFELDMGKEKERVETNAIVMAVQALPFEEYTLHLEFDQPLEGAVEKWLPAGAAP